MKHRASTPAVERPASPLGSAPVATRPEASLLAIMFHLLEGRDRWRHLPILCSLKRPYVAERLADVAGRQHAASATALASTPS